MKALGAPRKGTSGNMYKGPGGLEGQEVDMGRRASTPQPRPPIAFSQAVEGGEDRNVQTG